jgi:hypothetical protein
MFLGLQICKFVPFESYKAAKAHAAPVLKACLYGVGGCVLCDWVCVPFFAAEQRICVRVCVLLK